MILPSFGFYNALRIGNYSPPEGYSVAIQDLVNSPSQANNTQSSFKPATSSSGASYFYRGNTPIQMNEEWHAGTSVGMLTFTGPGYSGGGPYPTNFFFSPGPSMTHPSPRNWDTFAGAEFDGIQWITFYGSQGKLPLAYIRSAFITAFNGNNSYIHIARNGSVYKGSSYTQADLVVRAADMAIGQAGGGSSIHDLNTIYY